MSRNRYKQGYFAYLQWEGGLGIIVLGRGTRLEMSAFTAYGGPRGERYIGYRTRELAEAELNKMSPRLTNLVGKGVCTRDEVAALSDMARAVRAAR